MIGMIFGLNSIILPCSVLELCQFKDFARLLDHPVYVNVGSREKLKRKLDRYFQTTATKRKRLETVARTVETPPGELCVAFKMYLYIVYTITVPQDVIASQYQAESLVESIADHLEPLVKDVAV